MPHSVYLCLLEGPFYITIHTFADSSRVHTYIGRLHLIPRVLLSVIHPRVSPVL